MQTVQDLLIQPSANTDELSELFQNWGRPNLQLNPESWNEMLVRMQFYFASDMQYAHELMLEYLKENRDLLFTKFLYEESYGDCLTPLELAFCKRESEGQVASIMGLVKDDERFESCLNELMFFAVDNDCEDNFKLLVSWVEASENRFSYWQVLRKVAEKGSVSQVANGGIACFQIIPFKNQEVEWALGLVLIRMQSYLKGLDERELQTLPEQLMLYLEKFKQVVLLGGGYELTSDLKELIDELCHDKVQRLVNEIVLRGDFELEEKNKLVQVFNVIDFEGLPNASKWLRRVHESDPFKPLMTIQSTMFEQLNKLKTSFPNFSEVLNYLVSQFRLKQLSDCILHFKPILLVGNPGIGKTEFFHALSGILNLETIMFNVANMSASFSLTGTDASWRDGKPGAIANMLLNGKNSNFLLYLDEVEKSRPVSNGGDPLSVLYDLLEQRSAQKFVDEYFAEKVTFNASYMSVVATGNSLETIHPALRQRFHVFNIPDPDAEQSKTILQNIHLRLLEEYGISEKVGALSKVVLESLSNLTPREARKCLERVYPSVLEQGRQAIDIGDVEHYVCAYQEQNKSRSIGFY